MQLQAALVRLGHPVFERVKAVFRRHSLRAGQMLAPGVDIGLIEGVAGGADLQNDRVHAHLGAVVEDGVGFVHELFRVGRRCTRVIEVIDGADPDGAEILGRRLSVRRRSGQDEDSEGRREGEHPRAELLQLFHDTSFLFAYRGFCDSTKV